MFQTEDQSTGNLPTRLKDDDDDDNECGHH